MDAMDAMDMRKKRQEFFQNIDGPMDAMDMRKKRQFFFQNIDGPMDAMDAMDAMDMRKKRQEFFQNIDGPWTDGRDGHEKKEDQNYFKRSMDRWTRWT
jgi:hypothetical protein